MAKSKIIWDIIALNDFNNAIHFIADDSIQNAEKVKKEILDKISRLTDYPFMSTR